MGTQKPKKILIILLIVTSLIGYLEWGGNQHVFLFRAEADIISKMWAKPSEVIHPFTVLPLFGQLLLLFSLFQKKPSRALIWIGMLGIGLLLGFMFVIGAISMNYKIILSTIPYLVASFFMIKQLRRCKDPKHGQMA